MGGMPAYSMKQASALQVSLFAISDPFDSLGYHGCAGFLFAVACSPEIIPSYDWLPVVLGRDNMDQLGPENIKAIHAGLMLLYSELNQQVHCDVDVIELPPGCYFFEDPLSNLEDHAPMNQWSNGFAKGYQWLEQLKSESKLLNIADQPTEDLVKQAEVLRFFANEDRACTLKEELDVDDYILEEKAANMQAVFHSAMERFVAASLDTQVVRRGNKKKLNRLSCGKIGRNDSCLCGSGKKYKKCCTPH